MNSRTPLVTLNRADASAFCSTCGALDTSGLTIADLAGQAEAHLSLTHRINAVRAILRGKTVMHWVN